MPKVPPDHVERVEIVLGRADRELLEGAIIAYQINKIAVPMVDLLKDVTGLISVLTIIAALTGFTFIASDDLNSGEVIDLFLTQREQAIIAAGGKGALKGGLGPLGWMVEPILDLLQRSQGE